uniref:alcohol dehydrogenase n=1 Tax=Ceratitis capitata TaxID=7213 RepID=W8BWK3_CERCA
MDLNGKNVIYSGGFGGIGQHCLKELLSNGIKTLAILDVKENKEILADLQKAYRAATIIFIQFDITNKESIAAAFKEVVERIKHFDVLINGCGVLMEHNIDITIEVNLLGVIRSTLAALPYMAKNNGGRGGVIVNISSVAGLDLMPYFSIYTTTKHGVTAFGRCMADQKAFDQFGVSFITVCPGITETNLAADYHKKVTFDFYQEYCKKLNTAKRQSGEICAKNIVKVLRTGRNGGIYMLDVGEIKEITYPEFWKAEF